MSLSNSSFDRSSLILAWFSQRKYRNAHEDLRKYHDAVFAAFAKAFGIDLDVPPDRGSFPDESGLHGLFLQIAHSYERIGSPFSCYLCGTPEISEMYQKYGESLEKSAASMRCIYLTLMVELVERIWGRDASHRVTQQELETCGHPCWNAPDSVDYW